ncbi:hypothetical protein [Metabacillus endolithicus]|uniref:hypothetical protein n=1 Tax=Metabacillus endolithicus TaxID=1535204 RepID=UPI003CD0E034
MGLYLEGENGHSDVYIGVPSVINRTGIKKVVELSLNDQEQEKFTKSVQTLKDIQATIWG